MVSVRKHRSQTWLYIGEEGSIVEVVCVHSVEGSLLLREVLRLRFTLWLIAKAKTMQVLGPKSLNEAK